MEHRASSLLSLIASKTLEHGGLEGLDREEKDAQAEAQRATTMMYAARMKYLQDTDQAQPDTLFMTRKQAQKFAKQGSIKAGMTLKKLDVGGGHHQSAQADAKGQAAANSGLPNWKKQRGAVLLHDRQQTWLPLTQAGCHFWESQETGECRSTPPAPWAGRRHPDAIARDEDEEDKTHAADDDAYPPFPLAFSFLNECRK